MARPPQDPFKLIDTGRDAPLLWPVSGEQAVRVFHWACLHCGDLDTEDRTFTGAGQSARDHWYAKHLAPMSNPRTAGTRGRGLCRTFDSMAELFTALDAAYPR